MVFSENDWYRLSLLQYSSIQTQGNAIAICDNPEAFISSSRKEFPVIHWKE